MEPVTILKPTKGFTLIEMLVVLSIIVLITGIMVTSQSTFNKTLLLTDTAYNIALSVREAQTFGLSSRKFGSVSNAGYGVHFDRMTPGSYLTFADTGRGGLNITPTCPIGSSGRPDSKPGNCYYDAGIDGILNTYGFSRGFTIQNICIVVPGWGTYCAANSPSGWVLDSLDVVFTRPNTSTVITGTLNGWGYLYQQPASCAQITIADPTGQVTKNIRITQLGEVSVNQSCSS